MMYISRETQTYLERALSLRATGQEQDWAVELADPNRVEEFISSYERVGNGKNTSFALMSLIAASLDEKIASRLNKYDEEYIEIFEKNNFDVVMVYLPDELSLWRSFAEIMRGDVSNGRQIIESWAATGEDDMPFASSLLYRDWS